MRRCVCAIGLAAAGGAWAGEVSGPLTQWRPVTIDYAGPASGELADPNPFLDSRLQVEFVGPSGQVFDVPGFFAGDGQGSAEGGVWRVRFTPDEPGPWIATASFRVGPGVAVAVLADETPDPSAGAPAAFDGAVDEFEIAPPPLGEPGFFAKGRLAYRGEHYLTFPDGSPFVKGGADSPENWLGYVGFDNTPTARNTFSGHPQDFNPGDPTWDSPDTAEPNDGAAIIGALNYLAGTGVNSIYFLPSNIGGDGRDSWPYVGPIDPSGNPANDNTRFDLSKLEQWEIFFTHAQSLGVFLHFVMNEAEAPNKRELDDATLGPERRLFYREMAARFAHHLAMQWNVSEEYNLNLNIGSAEALRWAGAIKGQDPYDHPVTVHNAGNPANVVSGPWAPFIGQPEIDLTSLQSARRADGWGEIIADYREATALAGRPIPVMIDEPASPTRDVDGFDDFRRRVIWDVLVGGGGGEWFINNRDQRLDDFREFDQIWRETAIARRFVEEQIDVLRAEPARGLVTGENGFAGGGEALAIEGERYLVYLPQADNAGQALDLSLATGSAELRWFNPRSGAFEGAPVVLPTGGVAQLGPPPSEPALDWAALVVADGPIDPGAMFDLAVLGGSGSGAAFAGETVPVAADLPPGRAFDRWAGLGVFDPRDPTTAVTTPARAAGVGALTRPATDGPVVLGFSLIDSATDRALLAFNGDVTLAADNLPALAGLTLRADIAGGPIAQVAFTRDGGAGQVEASPPYSLSGDNNGDFAPLNTPLPLGETVIAATASGAGGAALGERVATIRIVAGPCPGDLNRDGLAGVGDVIETVARLAADDAGADADGSGGLDIFDLITAAAAVDAACGTP